MDISFSFMLGAGRAGMFQLHFMSIAGLRGGRFVTAFDACCFDGVDYPPKVMFNQTKWNDRSHQKN
ncbi:hypothetical protein ACFX5Q_04845 [Mesorhizobium sp. IMUNJ 23033]|uniref:hypothetical protein n=2 Tax=Phyllobacteriaceae TaxID=69277 RepID=UPI00384F8123